MNDQEIARIIERQYEREKQVDNDFKHYRQTGFGFSATLIGLSIAALHWADQAPDSWQRFIGITALCLAIPLSLLIQLGHYMGYMIQARRHFGQGYWSKPNPWFRLADWGVYIATASVVIGGGFTIFVWYLASF